MRDRDGTTGPTRCSCTHLVGEADHGVFRAAAQPAAFVGQQLVAAAHQQQLHAFVRAALPLAHDVAWRASLGAAARETACRIDWRSVVLRFESIVSQVIDSGIPALTMQPVHARA
jgi:hypothetical protein